MPIAIVVVFICRQTHCGEMCRWTVVGAPRARSSKCRLLGNKTRIMLKRVSRHRRNTAKRKPLSYTTTAPAPNVYFPLGYFIVAALSHRYTKKRRYEENNGSLFFTAASSRAEYPCARCRR